MKQLLLLAAVAALCACDRGGQPASEQKQDGHGGAANQVARPQGRVPDPKSPPQDRGSAGGTVELRGDAALYYLYQQVGQQQNPTFATAFLQDNLLDGLATSWIFLGFYYVNGLLAAFFYGAQSRVMDGMLARANCLLISTLWTAFKFIMLPIGIQLAAVFPKHEFAPVFALIWGSYMATDTCAEVFGSLFGKQRIRVWGIGDVNRKSVAGIVGGFIAALTLGVLVVTANGLGSSWLVLVLVIATSNTLLELYSPRGTDDFTMATANALICWAFGAWFR